MCSFAPKEHKAWTRCLLKASFVFPLNLHSTSLSIDFMVINTHTGDTVGGGDGSCCFPSAG